MSTEGNKNETFNEKFKLSYDAADDLRKLLNKADKLYLEVDSRKFMDIKLDVLTDAMDWGRKYGRK